MERNAKLDNLKAFLIFTVVLGHSLEFLYGTWGIYGIIRSIIYSFHMPAFIFLSGYFSKYSKKPLSHITVSYLSTYLIFNILFSLTPWHVAAPIEFLYPQVIYWYLLCLWYWRVSIHALSKLKFAIPLSILFALYIGCFSQADRFLSISRAFCFLPFFLAGYYCSMEKIERISKKYVLILLFVCFLATASLNRYGFIPVKMYEYIQSYSSTDVSNMHGILMRTVMMSISFVIIICLINLAPAKKLRIASCGRNSLIIYLVHIFPIRLLGDLGILNFNNYLLNIAVSIVMSVVLCFVLSRQFITSAYNTFINWLIRILTIPESKD